MDPITDAALALGSTIAKTLVTHWIRHQAPSPEHGDLTSIFKKYIPETLSQHRAKIQLERVATQIAEQTRTLFQTEGVHLESNSILAATIAVTHTLQQSHSIDYAVQENLDPTRLAKLYQSLNPTATSAFSEPEKELYNSILSYSTQFICDTAARLPFFTERSIGEILAREDTLILKTNEILSNFQRIHQALSTATGGAISEKFETDFRLATMRRLSEVSLFGLNISDTNRHYNLTTAYVSLTVQRHTREHPSKISPASKAEETEQTISVEDGLDSPTRRVVITGHAGTGKTTLLQWLAVQAAGRLLTGKLSKLNDYIPFFIRLREFATTELPPPERFASITTPELGGRMPPGWAHEKLSQAKAMLLVDGIDELPKNQRSRLREWVLALHSQYPGIALFLTSRPYASNDEWLTRHEFDKVELQPMDPTRISEFINHWHDAIRNQINSETQKEALTPLAASLKDLILSQPRLADLASTPLLCAMLCALHRERNQRLPSDRVSLYRACIEALVDRRDPERRIPLSDYPDLSFRHKTLLLQDFAYYLLRNNTTQASHEQLENRIASKLPGLGLSRAETPRDVCRLLVERSGILREATTERVDFIHKTFQEFLAAQAVLDEGDFGLLEQHATDDDWREVISLAVGLAAPKIANQLISSLITLGDTDRKRRHQAHLLAVSCLGEAAEIHENTRAEVGKRIERLVPPKTFREAKELAAAGDMAVPFLKFTDGTKAQHAAACVRALSLIGSESALDAIATFASDTRQGVRSELLKAWHFFEPHKYASTILSNEKQITIRGHIPLDTLRQFKSVERLFLERVQDFNIASLIPFQSIQFLRLHGNAHESTQANLQELNQLKNLKALNIFHTRIKELHPLDSLKELNRISLWNIPDFNELDKFFSAKNLEQVTLMDLPNAHKTLQLRHLSKLKTLTIHNVGRGSPIHYGCLPSGLTNLSFRARNGIRSLDFLRNLSALSALSLHAEKESAVPLGEFITHINTLGPQLKSLYLEGILTHMDFSLLANCTNLATLQLEKVSSLRNVEALSAMAPLSHIEFGAPADGIDLTPLQKLRHPFSLRISVCGALDVTPLLECPQLREISLYHVKMLKPDSLELISQRIPVDIQSPWDSLSEDDDIPIE